MQAGIYNRLFIKSDANRVYGWSSHNSIIATAKGSAWDNSFHKANECSPCSLLCFPSHQRGLSPLPLPDSSVLVNLVYNDKNGTVQWSWETIVMGVCFLLFLLATRHLVCCFSRFINCHFDFP